MDPFLTSTINDESQQMGTDILENDSEQIGTDILEDDTNFGAEPDMLFDDLDFPRFPLEDIEPIMEELVALSHGLEPTSSPTDYVPPEQPITNLKEWVVRDKVAARVRPPRLIEFLIRLLENPHYSSYASYTNRALGIFEIHQTDKVAALWKQVKARQSNPNMTYDNFARAIRWYYKQGIMVKTNTRHTFQFSPSTLRDYRPS